FAVSPRDFARLPRSFPTRRSSDLADMMLAAFWVFGQEGGQRGAIAPRLQQFDQRIAEIDEPDCHALVLEGPGLGYVGRAQHVSVDRKSTRLNSSHVKISYAVFCLK